MWQPGDAIALREIWRGRVWKARACTVVRDEPELVALWLPRGAPTKIPPGSGIPGADWTLEDGHFRTSALGLARPGAAHSILLFFAPVANVVLSAVRPEEEGQASGANNAIRELGGVFGVAVLASIFSRYGGYGTGTSFVDGMTPAIEIGAGVVAVGALAAFMIPHRRRRAEQPVSEPAFEAA